MLKCTSRSSRVILDISGSLNRLGTPCISMSQAVLGLLSLALTFLSRQMPRQANPDGQEILLWEDLDAQKDFEELINLVYDAESIEELGGLYGSQTEPNFWIHHRPNLRKDTSGIDETAEEDYSEEEGDDELGDAEIQALQPIVVEKRVENSVARKVAEQSPQIQYRHECPDCGERFEDWPTCRRHLELTGHLDVSNPEKEILARTELTQPVRWRCLECFEGFSALSKLEEHLKNSGHLDWADSKITKINLCKPRPVRGLDIDEMADSPDDSEVPAGPSSGFFRSLGSSLWSQAEEEAAPTEAKPTKAKKPKASKAVKKEVKKEKEAKEADKPEAKSTKTPKKSKLRHPDKKTEAEIEAESSLTADAKDRLRQCAAYDARFVLQRFKDVGGRVKNPLGYVEGVLKNLNDQGLITPLAKDALLLSLDDFDLSPKSMQLLHRRPVDEVQEVVQEMLKDKSDEPNKQLKIFVSKAKQKRQGSPASPASSTPLRRKKVKVDRSMKKPPVPSMPTAPGSSKKKTVKSMAGKTA